LDPWKMSCLPSPFVWSFWIL